MAPRLRADDVAEIVAAAGCTPLEALGRGFVESEKCLTVEFRGQASAMFGVTPGSSEYPKFGYVWLLGTDDIDLFSRQFLRQSRHWLAEVCKGYDVVGNYVDARNESHVRWLRWLNFRFIKCHDHFGHLGLKFFEFTMIPTEIE